MKTTGRELIDVLERISTLEWFKYSRYEHDVSEPTSAVVVWRFDSSQASNEQATEVVEAIRSALNAATNVEWSLKYTGRNWVLAPADVIKLEASGQFRTDGEVNKKISQQFPDFFSKAHADLAVIADTVACQYFPDLNKHD